MRLLFKGKVMVDQMKQCSIYEYLNKQSLDNDKIKFIDLFAGIGGFRIGF